jgi:hypothetical protein
MPKNNKKVKVNQVSPDFSTKDFRDFILSNVPKTQMLTIKVKYAIKCLIDEHDIQIGEKILFKKLEKDGIVIDEGRFYFSWWTIRAYYYGIKKPQ